MSTAGSPRGLIRSTCERPIRCWQNWPDIVSDKFGMRPLAAHCHLGPGTLYQQCGLWGQGAERTRYRPRDVPRDGDDVLAGEGGDIAGGDDRATWVNHVTHRQFVQGVGFAGLALLAGCGRLLRRGQAKPDRKAAALCRELDKWWAALWTFAGSEGVEPTNNVAERALRPAVLWRKGSFG